MKFLGIDVGTGGTRALVIDPAGRIVGSATSEHVPFATPRPGWAEQDPADWWRATGEPLFADFVFEIGDWVLEYQQEKTGAFINGHQSDTPGYTTALYLEGIGAAMRIAAALTDGARHKLYVDSFTRGLGFLDRLVIERRDASILPNIEFAVGGLRQSLTSSQIRIDFVEHSLSAILEAFSCSEESQAAATRATYRSPQSPAKSTIFLQ